MKNTQPERTEYLGREITPDGRKRWREVRGAMRRQLAPSIAVSVVFDVIEVVLLIALSFLLQYFIDGLQYNGTVNYVLLLLLAAAIVLRAVNSYLLNYSNWRLSAKGQQIVSVHMYKAALSNDELLSAVKSGDITNIVGRDSQAMGERLGARTSYIICGVLQTIAVLAIIFYFSWLVGIAVLVFYPLYFFFGRLIAKKQEKQEYLNSRAWANTSHIALKGIQDCWSLPCSKNARFMPISTSNLMPNPQKRS